MWYVGPMDMSSRCQGEDFGFNLRVGYIHFGGSRSSADIIIWTCRTWRPKLRRLAMRKYT